MTHEEILTQLYDQTLVGDKPAVVELTDQRARDRARRPRRCSSRR